MHCMKHNPKQISCFQRGWQFYVSQIHQLKSSAPCFQHINSQGAVESSEIFTITTICYLIHKYRPPLSFTFRHKSLWCTHGRCSQIRSSALHLKSKALPVWKKSTSLVSDCTTDDFLGLLTFTGTAVGWDGETLLADTVKRTSCV